jgi:hypothetical protein
MAHMSKGLLTNRLLRTAPVVIVYGLFRPVVGAHGNKEIREIGGHDTYSPRSAILRRRHVLLVSWFLGFRIM